MAHFHNPPTLTDAQIQLAHDMNAVRSAVAKGFVLPPDPEVEQERADRSAEMDGDLPEGGVWWSNRAGECRLLGPDGDPLNDEDREVWTEVHPGTRIVRWIHPDIGYARFLAEGMDANSRGETGWVIDPNQADEALLNGCAPRWRPDKVESPEDAERASAERRRIIDQAVAADDFFRKNSNFEWMVDPRYLGPKADNEQQVERISAEQEE